MSVKVYGLNDDEVMINGDIEECYYSFNRPCKIIFSNGLEVQFEYKGGRWHCNTLHTKNDNKYQILSYNDSDQLQIDDTIEWCILDVDSKYELQEMVEERINWDKVDEETLKDLYIKFCKTYAEDTA